MDPQTRPGSGFKSWETWIFGSKNIVKGGGGWTHCKIKFQYYWDKNQKVKLRYSFLSKRDSFIWQNCHVLLKCHSLRVDRQIIHSWFVALGFHCPQYLIYIYSQYGRNMQQCNTKASLPSCTKLQIHCWRHKSGKPSVCWAKLWDDPRSIYSSKFTSPISCQNWWKVHISGYTCEKNDTHGRIHVGTRQTSWERVIKKCESVLFILTGPFIEQNTWTPNTWTCIVYT